MTVYTLTLNPAFDLHCTCEEFRTGHENLAENAMREAGGKGINLSRALKTLGVESQAIVIVGAENGEEFLKEVAADGVKASPIFVSGRIRENITVHGGTEETRLSFPGFSVEPIVINEVRERLNEAGSGDIVTLNGSLPKGIDKQELIQFLAQLQKRGVKLVLDSHSFTAEDLQKIKPWVIKPNEEEIANYIGDGAKNALEEEAVYSWAERMHQSGVENVIVSLGAKGAILVREEGRFRVEAPKIEPISTIGAGDSMLAGWVAAWLAGCDKADCLRTAVACGSAACLTEGTKPPKKEDIERIAKSI